MANGYLLRTAILAVCAADTVGRLASVLDGSFVATDVTALATAAEAHILVVDVK